MPGKFGGNLHPAMLPVLLMASQNGREMEKALDDLLNFIQLTKTSLETLRSGIESFHSGMLKMSSQEGRPPQGFTSSYPAGSPGASNQAPAADPDKAPENS